jgi:hypothetical protein
MRRLLLALVILTAMTVPSRALLTYPPGFVCESGNNGEVCVGVDVRPDVPNGNTLITSSREVSVLDAATTSAGSTALTIRATELIDPQIHSPYIHFITESKGKAGSVDDGTRCGPEHFWSLDGFVWRTTQSDYNSDDDQVTSFVHNGIYRIEAITDGAWWNVGPNYQVNCGSPKEKLDITAEKIVYVNNLVVRDLDTPRVLVWQPGASFPIIPVTLSDGGPLENTEINIRIYPLCYDKMYWLSPDKPARTIKTTINGSTNIIWDALDDRGQQVPP